MIIEIEEHIVELRLNDREQTLAVMVNFDCTVGFAVKLAYSGHCYHTVMLSRYIDYVIHIFQCIVWYMIILAAKLLTSNPSIYNTYHNTRNYSQKV